MKRFIIERRFPGAGSMTIDELRAISQTSNSAVSTLGKPYVWIQSFVTGDKIFCIHEAEDAEVIKEHSACANFPIYSIEEIKTVISPDTGK